MLKVTNNQITLTRGDTAELHVAVTDLDGDIYDCHGDKAYFRVKLTPESSELLLEKELSIAEDGGLIIFLNEDDTDHLEFTKYNYEVEIVTTNNRHYTIIEKGTIKLGPELENHGE